MLVGFGWMAQAHMQQMAATGVAPAAPCSVVSIAMVSGAAGGMLLLMLGVGGADGRSDLAGWLAGWLDCSAGGERLADELLSQIGQRLWPRRRGSNACGSIGGWLYGKC